MNISWNSCIDSKSKIFIMYSIFVVIDPSPTDIEIQRNIQRK